MTEQREGMTELSEGITELDKLIQAAQAVLNLKNDDYPSDGGEWSDKAINAYEALRQAVEQAKGVEAVEEQYKCCKVFDDGDVSYAWATETEIENMHKWEKVVPEVKRNLYTTPPSIYALIAQAIEKHDEKMTVIKTVNTRKIAQPYIDELIAEIDGLGINFDCTDEQSYQNRIVYWEDIKSILDKYRSK